MPNIAPTTASDSPETSAVEKPELPDAPYMDTPTAARHTGLSESFLNKLRMRDNGPPFIKIGRRAVRYRRDDLDRWMASQLVTQDSPEAA